MSEASEKFELQIKRIHDLIEQSGAEITWDDHIPDPDNPEQPRQIDVSIKRDDTLTLLECRIHKKRQDVKWVEELIGRRISLNADAIIAVSASGFSRGAVLKAKAHGVILRDFLSLTEQEVQTWGKKTKVSVTLFKYDRISMVFTFDKVFQNKIFVDHIEQAFLEDGSKFRGIFDKVASGIEDKNPDLVPCLMQVGLSSRILTIQDVPIRSILFQAYFEADIQHFEIPSVVAYDTPEFGALERNVYVEQVELGEFEIMQSTDNVSVALDLSPITMPYNCQFRSVNFEFSRSVLMDSVYILGLPELGIPIANLDIGVRFE
ncbi:MAG: restriction endonuclease [Deltaproteobacteria bacterium]|nr:restriction endonuclease [Deltaproteobacteria bacterium]